MAKRRIKKHRSAKSKKTIISTVYIRLASFALVIIAILLVGKGFLSSVNKVHVLGAQTGPVLLADHGGSDSGTGDSSGSSGSGDNGGGGSSGGGSSSGGGTNSSGDGNTSGGSGSSDSQNTSQSSVSDNTQVDCVGPDGKHFTTSFKSCSELNDSWHHSNFSFTPLNTPQQPEGQTNETPKSQTVQQDLNPEELGNLNVKTEDGRARFNLTQNGVSLKIEQEGDSVKTKAEKPDGTEVDLDTKDSLDKINKELETEGIEVATTDANSIVIKTASVEAETELPLNVDPLSHELSVTTPAGTKTVTVLPDQAVNNLLENKDLTSIQSQSNSLNGITQNINLTEVNNEPAFQIQGVLQKKVLGIIPVGFAKTEFVSATTGQVIKTDESVLNKLLETVSF